MIIQNCIDGMPLFIKLFGRKTKTINNIFFLSHDKCNKDIVGKFNKTLQTLWDEFGGKFFMNSITMVILDGDEVKGNRIENYIW